MKKHLYLYIYILLFVAGGVCSLLFIHHDFLLGSSKKIIVFLSGSGMKEPVKEIAQRYSDENGVNVVTQFSGSSILRDYILKFKTGAIFLPGDKSNLDKLKKRGVVEDEFFMAWHKVAILVSPEMKGKITSLDDLAQKGIRLVFSNPELASLGKLVKKRIIDRHPLGKEILDNVVVYGSSTLDVLRIYQEGGVDAVIEWDVMAFTQEGKGLVVVPIDPEYSIEDPLMVGLLNTAKYPKLADHFYQYLQTEGRQIFLNHKYDIEE